MAVSHHNTLHTKTCDPPATCTKTYGLYKSYTAYGISIMTLRFSTEPKSFTLCPENVLPLAGRPHSTKVVHQLHHILPRLPSVCQMGNSDWTIWTDLCAFKCPASVVHGAFLWGYLHLVLFLCLFFCIQYVILSTILCSKKKVNKGKGNCLKSNLVELPVTPGDTGNFKDFCFIPKSNTMETVCFTKALGFLSNHQCAFFRSFIDISSAYTVQLQHQRKRWRLWQPFISTADITGRIIQDFFNWKGKC